VFFPFQLATQLRESRSTNPSGTFARVESPRTGTHIPEDEEEQAVAEDGDTLSAMGMLGEDAVGKVRGTQGLSSCVGRVGEGHTRAEFVCWSGG